LHKFGNVASNVPHQLGHDAEFLNWLVSHQVLGQGRGRLVPLFRFLQEARGRAVPGPYYPKQLDFARVKIVNAGKNVNLHLEIGLAKSAMGPLADCAISSFGIL
jgi:hypothetical protein